MAAGGGLCILGDITFRINPDLINWSYEVYTNVIPTLGGRVVQVLGAALSDITIHGLYGDNHAAIINGVSDGSPDGPGRSWRLADGFADNIHRLMKKQSPPPGAVVGYQQPVPLRWFYPDAGWDFLVYITALQDGRGSGVVDHEYGKFSYDYVLTLFPVKDNTYGLTGDTTTLSTARDAAITTAIERISAGIGWEKTKFNDPGLHDALFSDHLDGNAPQPGSVATTKGRAAPGARRVDGSN